MLISSALPQQRAARVALVVGNNSYPDASTPLSSTIRDARTLAEELRRSEFDVDLKENVGKEDMQRAIDSFTGKIRNGTAALVYFGGYGVQVARQTYLLRSMPRFGLKPTSDATASVWMPCWPRCTAKVQR